MKPFERFANTQPTGPDETPLCGAFAGNELRYGFADEPHLRLLDIRTSTAQLIGCLGSKSPTRLPQLVLMRRSCRSSKTPSAIVHPSRVQLMSALAIATF